MTPLPLSEYLQSVLEYTSGIRLLLEAKERGTLADPNAIESELCRIERSVAHVIGLLKGTVP